MNRAILEQLDMSLPHIRFVVDDGIGRQQSNDEILLRIVNWQQQIIKGLSSEINFANAIKNDSGH